MTTKANSAEMASPASTQGRGKKAMAATGKEATAAHRYMTSTARRWECPAARSRWCMCMRSGWVGLSPFRVRRTIAIIMSVRGSRRTASGRRIGMKAGRAREPSKLPGSICPVTMMVEAAETSPSCIAPESPMKMVAGLKLCGRKPTHTPMSAATMVAAREL